MAPTSSLPIIKRGGAGAEHPERAILHRRSGECGLLLHNMDFSDIYIVLTGQHNMFTRSNFVFYVLRNNFFFISFFQYY